MFVLKLSTWITYVFYLVATTLLCVILNGSYYFYALCHSNAVPSKRQYEYIIVGTGTAGSIIASGIPSTDVLVLEYGSMRNGLMDIPLLGPLLQRTSYDWQYRSEPQHGACGALTEGQSYWPMGKVYGGTNMLNNMIHYRAERKDFRGWFDNEDKLDDFMDYFDRSGVDETMHVEREHFGTELGDAFIDGAVSAGLDKDLFYKPNLTMKHGRRWTASHRYSMQDREGHELILNALVTKISIKEGRAVMAVFEKAGQTIEVGASKGIILAAGVVGSPKILMQSGIGPREHLETLGINLVADLPVGNNLQDHVTTGMDLVILSKGLPLRPWHLIHPKNVWNYFVNQGTKSSLSLAGCESLGFVNLGSNFTHNLGFMVLPVGITIDAGFHLQSLINLRQDIYEKYFKPLVDNGQQTVSILPILLHPKSRGYIRLRDADSHSNPIVQPNYLSHEEDVRLLVTGIKILQQIIDQPAMSALGAEINPKPFPGCEKHKFGTDSYWECYVRSLTLTLYHPVGTCRMGAGDNPYAVVSDKDFGVHKLDNLYVVDGSIMPNLPSGNPNSVIAALAKYFLRVKFSDR